MTWEPEMTHLVPVATATGVDSDGEYTYGSPATVNSRVVEDRKEIQVGTGRSVMSSHRIVSHVAILETSRVWLPGADTDDITESHPVIQTRRTQSLDDTESIYQTWI